LKRIFKQVKKLHVIKIGGNIIDDPQKLETFLSDFSAMDEVKILVHGGGKLATSLADTLGIKQTMIDGRRVTDAETLNVTVMVYAGLINKTLVAKLQLLHCNAMGFCGADGNLIRAKKREHTEIDFGFVGDLVPGGVDVKQFELLLDAGIIPVISPITHDGAGNLLNTNADTLATNIALALSSSFDVMLTYCFEKNGVLADPGNDDSFISSLNKQRYLELKASGIISKGMLPKLDNAFMAFENGVKQVSIRHAQHISGTYKHIAGTQLTVE
jgi:acetylglutamate kinase